VLHAPALSRQFVKEEIGLLALQEVEFRFLALSRLYFGIRLQSEISFGIWPFR